MTATPISMGQGAKATPNRYTLTGDEELSIESVFAKFDGSGAAGSFKPALGIYAPGGFLLARSFTDDTLAAGASADVTFFPRLARGAAAAAATGLPMAQWVQGSFTTITGAGTHFPVNANSFKTTDASYFDTASQVIGGQTYIGVRFLKSGIYVAFTIATVRSLTIGDSITFSTDDEPGNSNPFLQDSEFGGPYAAPHATSTFGFMTVYQMGPVSNPPPSTSFAYFVANNTAARGSYTGGAFYAYLGTGDIFS